VQATSSVTRFDVDFDRALVFSTVFSSVEMDVGMSLLAGGIDNSLILTD
jgi:hypothetical protein